MYCAWFVCAHLCGVLAVFHVCVHRLAALHANFIIAFFAAHLDDYLIVCCVRLNMCTSARARAGFSQRGNNPVHNSQIQDYPFAWCEPTHAIQIREQERTEATRNTRAYVLDVRRWWQQHKLRRRYRPCK